MEKICTVLFASKPLSLPLDDSGKSLPYLIAKRIRRLRIRAPGVYGLPIEGVDTEPVYRSKESLRISISEKIRLLLWLIRASTPDIIHFFFTPNIFTNMAVEMVRMIHPNAKTIQTIMSIPKDTNSLKSLIFSDKVVVWSLRAKKMLDDLLGEAIRKHIVHIKPGIEPLSPLSDDKKRKNRLYLGLPLRTPVVLITGDLDWDDTMEVSLEILHQIKQSMNVMFAYAIRRKSEQTFRKLARMKHKAQRMCLTNNIFFYEGCDFLDLLRVCDIQLFLQTSTYAKTDIPLSILQGMSAKVPCVVARNSPLDEIVESGGLIGVCPNDFMGFSSTIIRLLQDKDYYTDAQERCQRYMLAHHHADKMALEHERLYLSLLEISCDR